MSVFSSDKKKEGSGFKPASVTAWLCCEDWMNGGISGGGGGKFGSGLHMFISSYLPPFSGFVDVRTRKLHTRASDPKERDSFIVSWLPPLDCIFLHHTHKDTPGRRTHTHIHTLLSNKPNYAFDDICLRKEAKSLNECSGFFEIHATSLYWAQRHIFTSNRKIVRSAYSLRGGGTEIPFRLLTKSCHATVLKLASS